MAADLVDHGVGDLLDADAFFAEADEGFGDVGRNDLAGENEARPAFGAVFDDFADRAGPAEAFGDLAEGAFGDVCRKSGEMGDGAAGQDRPRAPRISTGWSFWTGSMRISGQPPPVRIEAGTHQGRFDFGTEAGELREGRCAKENRRAGHMDCAFRLRGRSGWALRPA